MVLQPIIEWLQTIEQEDINVVSAIHKRQLDNLNQQCHTHCLSDQANIRSNNIYFLHVNMLNKKSVFATSEIYEYINSKEQETGLKNGKNGKSGLDLYILPILFQ